MGRACTWAGALLAVAILSIASAIPASGQEDPMVEASKRMEAAIEGLVAFTSGVTLDEARLRRVLNHAPALYEITSDEESDELMERAFADGRYDFRVILLDPEYVAWCRGRELDAQGFLKDLMRLEALVLRQETSRELQEALDGLPEQRRQWQQMRGQMGEEAYKAALAATDASAASIKRSLELMKRVPAPSQEEARLLLEYGETIRQALGDDEGDDESWPEEPDA